MLPKPTSLKAGTTAAAFAAGVTMATHYPRIVARATNALVTALNATTQLIAAPHKYAVDVLQAIL